MLAAFGLKTTFWRTLVPDPTDDFVDEQHGEVLGVRGEIRVDAQKEFVTEGRYDVHGMKRLKATCHVQGNLEGRVATIREFIPPRITILLCELLGGRQIIVSILGYKNPRLPGDNFSKIE